MAGTGGARDGRELRHRRVLNRSPDELCSEGRGVKATGGALARRVWCVGFGGWMHPTPNVVRSGGAESSPVMGMLAGLSVASGA